MAYVTETGIGGTARAPWAEGGPACSSAEVDLEVIEEYLQEHSQEVQPAYTADTLDGATTQPAHTHSQQDPHIIGQQMMKRRRMIVCVCVCVCVYVYVCVCVVSDYDWSELIYLCVFPPRE